MWQMKPKKQPWHANVHLQSIAINNEDHGNYLLGPLRCAACVISSTVVTVYLLCVTVVHFELLQQANHHKRLCPGIIVLHDNANQTCDSLWHYSWEVMNHPHYGPDLTPSDFHLCGLLKKHLAGKKMAKDPSIKQNVISWLQTLDTSCFCAEIQAMVPQ